MQQILQADAKKRAASTPAPPRSDNEVPRDQKRLCLRFVTAETQLVEQRIAEDKGS